jgi:hypothetical protein
MDTSYLSDLFLTAAVHAVVGGAVLAPLAYLGTTAAFSLGRQSVLFFAAIGTCALGMFALSMGSTGLETGSEWQGEMVDTDDPDRFLHDASAPYGFRIGFAFLGASAYTVAAFFFLL